jgi:SAM-dependent methyltransferase
LDQERAWNEIGSGKTFTHPLEREWLAECVPQGGRILDLGCGYGRLFDVLTQLGFTPSGADRSERMVALARDRHSGTDVRRIDSQLPWPDESFDCVLMITLLTSVPRRDEQQGLVREAVRVLAPNGHLYISDLPIQWDERSLTRYHEGTERFGEFGVFSWHEQLVFRHHSLEYLANLLAPAFRVRRMEAFDVRTMDGTNGRAVRLLAQVRPKVERSRA